MIETRGLIGDSLYPASNGGSGDYAHVGIAKAESPVAPCHRPPIPKTGVWEPTVHFEADRGFAYIDPALHAVPPSKGVVVFEGAPGPRGLNRPPDRHPN